MPLARIQHGTVARQREQRLFWLSLACGALLIALAGPFLLGLIYVHDDLGAFHLPLRAFYASCLLFGERFDWMPHLFNGFYLTGEGQAGTYHPLHWILYRWLPFTTAFNLNILLSYPAMLAGSYCFLRRRVRRPDAALFGALLFTFSGFNLLHFAHMNAVAVVAHLPWLLWAIDIALRTHDRRRAVAAELLIVLLTASQLLLGYPQYVWYSLLAEITFGLLLFAGTSLPKRRVWGLAFAGLLGLLIGSVQFLPTVDALFSSARRETDASFAGWGSLAPINLIQFVAPYVSSTRVAGQNTHELGLYLGAVPLLLVAWLLTPRAEPGCRRRFGWIAACCAGGALLLALGTYGPLHAVVSRLPLVGNFRFPCRAIVLVHGALAIAAAAAWLDLSRRIEQQRVARWSLLAPLWGLVGLSVVASLWAVLSWDPQYLASWPLIVTGPLLMGLAAFLISAAARGSHVALIAAALLAAVDLGVYGLSYSVYPHVTTFDRYLAQAELPPGTPHDRFAGDLVAVDESALRLGDQALLAGFRRADGYLGLEPARRLDYEQRPALQLSGVRWVARTAIDDVAQWTTTDDAWLEVADPLPRARCVSRSYYDLNPAAALSRVPLDQSAIVQHQLFLDGSTPAEVEIVTDRPGRIELRVEPPSKQLLVLSETFHRGWRAEINGRPAEVLRVNGDFLGCLVDRQTKQVSWTFRPASLRYGWWMTFFGVVATGCFATVRFHQTRSTDRIS